jgi:hypothetical protein
VTALGAFGVAPERIAEELFEVQEHLAVIRHDHLLIALKVHRAIAGAALERPSEQSDGASTNGASGPECGGGTHPREPDQDPGSLQTDENGSAKVALLAVARSTAAWHAIARHHPRGGAAVSGPIDCLERLARDVHRRFPSALAFRRPGFEARAP